MRVLLISESYWPNSDGGAVFERRLVQGLIARGHTVFVWTPGTKFTSYTQADGESLIFREKSLPFLPNPRYHISFLPWTSGAHVFKEARPDVVHLQNQGLIWYAGLSYARRHHIPVVATNHFMPENWTLNMKLGSMRQPVINFLWRRIVNGFNRCNFVTTPTPTALKLLTDHGLKTESQAVSNGVDMSQFKRQSIDRANLLGKYDIPEDREVLLYVGRLEGEKQINVIVDALPILAKNHNIQFVAVGAGIMHDKLIEQAKQLGVADRMTLTGFVEEPEKIEWYNAAKVFAIASIAELQSIVTLEGMSIGLPVVAADAIALKELCHDGENGFLFRPGDSAALARSVDKLLTDKALCERFSKESIKIVQQSHSTEAMFKTYEAIYKHVISEQTIA